MYMYTIESLVEGLSQNGPEKGRRDNKQCVCNGTQRNIEQW